MNKKLLFGIMSLAALAACTNDDFDSQQQVAEGTSPIQFEVINDDASMRAYMTDKDAVAWQASKGDIFTLYHGATYADVAAVTGYQNATYKAVEGTDEKATLTTPSMILPGSAIMVWPADTTFSIKSGDNLSFSIPAKQPKDIENYIPYASDLIKIGDYAKYDDENAYNTAGKDRKYPVYMRTMASLLKLKSDIVGTDKLAGISTGEDKIDPIKATSVQLITKAGGETQFTTQIPVTFTKATAEDNTRWNTTEASKVPNNAWTHVTGVDRDNVTGQSATLTTECLDGNTGCKFIILPQKKMETDGKGVEEAGVIIKTNYGQVYISGTYPSGYQDGFKYTPEELKDAWYRYVSAIPATEADGETTDHTAVNIDGKTKYKATSKPEFGLKQTINGFGESKAGDTKPTVKGEYIGGVTTRYVKVLLSRLNMNDLHIKNDKQLRDVARVWKELGLAPVTVILDGGQEDDAEGEFTISQQTIEVINKINGAYSASNTTPKFQVKPCTESGEECKTIVVEDGGDVPNMPFIAYNGSEKVYVNLKAGLTWKWKGDVMIPSAAVNRVRNFGTLVNSETATLRTTEFDGSVNDGYVINNGKWNITEGTTLNVQFTVFNNDTVNIATGAQYRQDGVNHKFQNQASAKPTRFGGDDSKIGVVINKGVFATVNDGKIHNLGGLIEHADKDAKTFISTNQSSGADFKNPYGSSNKMGRINLPYSNKDEDNISINAAAEQGFVSVTVTKEELEKAGATSDALFTTSVGKFVNYIIVNSGIKTISELPAGSKIKYVEIADKDKNEIAWSITTAQSYEGLIVLSPVNIKLGTSVSATVTYLGADMYVGGTFNKAGTDWDGYYGKTSGNVATKYITF